MLPDEPTDLSPLSPRFRSRRALSSLRLLESSTPNAVNAGNAPWLMGLLRKSGEAPHLAASSWSQETPKTVKGSLETQGRGIAMLAW